MLKLTTILLGFATMLAAAATWSAQATFAPVRDNTIYSDFSANSNGTGVLFTGDNGGGGTRRALLKFDVAVGLPADASIVSATLQLKVSRANLATPLPASLHRLTSDWGEGASFAGTRAGAGTQAQPNDATWVMRFYPATPWISSGGDFIAGPSASGSLGGVGTYVIGSTPGMVADVHSWLTSPATNFGWVLRGDETQSGSARQLHSRESDVVDRPLLTVEYTVPVAADVPLPPWAIAVLAAMLIGILGWRVER